METAVQDELNCFNVYLCERMPDVLYNKICGAKIVAYLDERAVMSWFFLNAMTYRIFYPETSTVNAANAAHLRTEHFIGKTKGTSSF
ncbi:unnamed protein product [Brugia timori]|uniref:Uncharacterized protein n=1 Tax=Brugia timori TaxID=42155 RepID=A0A0R3QWW2_9BILA|nr:unnamed protein product [Brugia timori]